MVSYLKKVKILRLFLQCKEPVLSEKSSSPGKSGNTTVVNRLISAGELREVAIKHLIELSKRKTCHEKMGWKYHNPIIQPTNDTTSKGMPILTDNTPLQKHAYSNILKISPPKTESFQIQKADIFHISAQNIDCGYNEIIQIKNSDIFHISAQNIYCVYLLEPPRRGGSNEYPQSMFLSRNKKNNVYPCKPQFYYIKLGFKGFPTK